MNAVKVWFSVLALSFILSLSCMAITEIMHLNTSSIPFQLVGVGLIGMIGCLASAILFGLYIMWSAR